MVPPKTLALNPKFCHRYCLMMWTRQGIQGSVLRNSWAGANIFFYFPLEEDYAIFNLDFVQTHFLGSSRAKFEGTVFVICWIPLLYALVTNASFTLVAQLMLISWSCGKRREEWRHFYWVMLCHDSAVRRNRSNCVLSINVGRAVKR